MQTTTLSTRIDPRTKQLFVRAATLERRTLTEFIHYHCEEAAHAALAKEQARKASSFCPPPLRRKRKVVKA